MFCLHIGAKPKVIVTWIFTNHFVIQIQESGLTLSSFLKTSDLRKTKISLFLQRMKRRSIFVQGDSNLLVPMMFSKVNLTNRPKVGPVPYPCVIRSTLRMTTYNSRSINPAIRVYFVSDRFGTNGGYDIYFFHPSAKVLLEGFVVDVTGNPVDHAQIEFTSSRSTGLAVKTMTDETGAYKVSCRAE